MLGRVISSLRNLLKILVGFFFLLCFVLFHNWICVSCVCNSVEIGHEVDQFLYILETCPGLRTSQGSARKRDLFWVI